MKAQVPPRPHQLPEARFTDYFEMGYEPCVFKMFFGQVHRTEEDRRLATGLVMSPEFAKALVRHLQVQLDRYEEDYGPIQDWYRESKAKMKGAGA
jgi:hypothetical protein